MTKVRGVGCMQVVMVAMMIITMMMHNTTAEWVPKLDTNMEAEKWESMMGSFEVTKGYKKCSDLHSSTSGVHRFLSLYRDVPATIVLVGESEGHVDIKFKDSNYIFDQSVKVDKSKYLVIPPYQPVEWLWLRVSGTINICIYEESPRGGLGNGEEEKNEGATGCACSQLINGATSSYSASFPHTIRKPEQPFFLTADSTPAKDDVTICTILTVDRLLRVSQMSQLWGGPISAAVFLHEASEVEEVMKWYLSNNTMRAHVDIHLVFDDKIVAFPLPDRAFPVNILRNVAIRFARSANVFYIEGDFIPSPDLYPSLGPIRKQLASGEKAVYIVAPFSSDKADFDMRQFPKDKAALQDLVKSRGTIKDLSYYNSHSAFDFNKWYKSNEVYSMSFSGGYEPYYIGPKTYPLFEEIFIGCGADKVSHPTELNAAGYSFKVLPTGFIVHIDSSGMGSAWCRGWAGNDRSTMKWEAFTTKTGHIYRSSNKGSFDSRVPWWDLAPVALTKELASGTKEEDGVCEAPKKDVCPPCPVPAQNLIEPQSCSQEELKEATKELTSANLKLKKQDEDLAKRQTQVASLETSVRTLRKENEAQQEYIRFVINLSIGVVVVMVVVLGVGVCIWPRGKKVWVLPTSKPTHHNL